MNSGESRHLTHNSSLSTVHSHAFTLAETLIVMGIIGIVAALTIPNLNGSTNDMEKVAKVKKIYAELAQAHDRMIAVYGQIDNSWWSEKYFDRITEFMKLQKSCRDLSSGETCFPKNRKYLYSEESIEYGGSIYSAISASGTAFEINFQDGNFEYGAYDVSENKDSAGMIEVDIDGPNKGKNKYGIDLFRFNIGRDGVSPIATSKFLEESVNTCTYEGWTCSTWIIDNGNMDYLKTKSRTDTAQSRECPNGKILGYKSSEGEVTSCK